MQLGLLRGQNRRNINPAGILQELKGSYIAINRSAIEWSHLPSSVWASGNNDFWQILEEQKKDDPILGVSWDYHRVISKLGKKIKDRIILWPHIIPNITNFYTRSHIVLWGRIVIWILEALSIRWKIAAHL